MKLCDIDACTGCLACVNVCNKNALNIHINNEGFYEPKLVPNKCINCGLCENTCPILNHTEKNHIIKCYACWSKSETTRKDSSSGGFFSEIAKEILNQDGVIYGASFDKSFSYVKHIRINKINDLYNLRGSKYLQSNIELTYRKVKDDLTKNKLVLFSGTPCEIAGLKSFLKKDFVNLLTIDIICHGVPSPLVYTKYKQWLEKKFHSHITSFKFRDKDKSWKISNTKAIFKNSTYIGKWHIDPYLRLFLRNLILRKSCYKCIYASKERVSDITIGDFWGYKSKTKNDRNTDKGISLVIINTKRGEIYFNATKNNLIYFHREIIDVVNSQRSLSQPWPEPNNRKTFWKDFSKLSTDSLFLKYAYPEKLNLTNKILSKFGYNFITNKALFFLYKIYGIKNKLNMFFNHHHNK